MSLVWDEDLERSVPFASVFRPWVEEAAGRLSLPPVITDDAVADLERSLLSRLSQHGALAALALFDDGRPAGYDAFVDGGPERVADAFAGFTHLADLLADQWVSTCAELGARVEAELDALPGGGGGPRAVRALRPRLGDPHGGGRHVTLVVLEDDRCVLLKPRSLAPEAAFFALAARSPGLLADGAPWVVDHGDHGWMAFVGQGPVRDAPAYWRAVGRMLAVLQAVGATDLHQSNVIATGNQLVPIDLECLLVPEVVGRTGAGTTLEATFSRDSALGTGLLPRALQHDGPVAVEWCGLTGRPGQLNGRWRPGWTGLGTDAIGRHRAPLQTPAAANQAVDPEGRPVPLELAALLGGYRDETHDATLGPGPLEGLGSLRTRVVLRPTSTYAERLAEATEPDHLGSVADLTAALDDLPALDPDLADALGGAGVAALLAAERAALGRLDVPLVWAEEGDLIVDDGTRLTGVVSRTGRERVVARRARWTDPAWRRAEAALVAVALEPVAGSLPATGESAVGHPRPDPLSAAVAVAESLADDAIALDPDRVGWVEVVPLGRSGRLQAVLAPGGLYRGGEGIAAFLAVLAAATGDERWETLARRALPPAPSTPDGDPSYAVGSSGWAWAASVVGEALRDDTLLEAAGAAVRDTKVDIGRRDPLDLIGGWAGTVAAAAAVAHRTGDPATASVAIAFGRDLAAAAQARLEDEARPLARLGVAHGSPGVSLALGAAFHLGGDGSTGAAFERLVDLEDDRIARRGGVGGRIDQGGRRRVPSRTWCWGVSGHLIASAEPWLASHDRSASVAVSFDLLADGDRRLAHACCGTAGHLEAAVAARDDLGVAAAGPLVDQLVAGLSSGPHRFHDSSGFAAPSLFRGRAGIGMALLRAHDRRTPSALAVT